MVVQAQLIRPVPLRTVITMEVIKATKHIHCRNKLITMQQEVQSINRVATRTNQVSILQNRAIMVVTVVTNLAIRNSQISILTRMAVTLPAEVDLAITTRIIMRITITVVTPDS